MTKASIGRHGGLNISHSQTVLQSSLSSFNPKRPRIPHLVSLATSARPQASQRQRTSPRSRKILPERRHIPNGKSNSFTNRIHHPTCSRVLYPCSHAPPSRPHIPANPRRPPTTTYKDIQRTGQTHTCPSQYCSAEPAAAVRDTPASSTGGERVLPGSKRSRGQTEYGGVVGGV